MIGGMLQILVIEQRQLPPNSAAHRVEMPHANRQADRPRHPQGQALRQAQEAGRRRRDVLELHATGARYWRLKYRMAGKEKRLSLGVYPETGLRDARGRRDEARRQIAAGIDPSDKRKAAKEAAITRAELSRLVAQGNAAPGTFEHVAREWLGTVHEVKVSPGHAERTRIRLEQDAFPWLGHRPIADIEAPELLQCLRRV